MNAFRALIAKDLSLLTRRRGGLLSAFALGAIVMLMLSLSGDSTPEGLGRRQAAAFWIGLFLGSTLFLLDAFDSEHRDAGQRSLIVLGGPATAFFYSKAVVNAIGLFGVGVLLTPISFALFGVAPALGPGLVILAFGVFSLAAPGTLFSAIVAESDRRHLLLPVIMFPLVVPVLVTVVQSTVLATFGDPMGQGSAWWSLLGVFALLHWLLDGALYARAVD